MPSRQLEDKHRSDAHYVAAVKSFEAAMRYFRKGNYGKAKETFEKLVSTSSSDIADRARIYVRLCQQRLSRPAPAPKTPEEFYDLAVAELNSRNLVLAIEYLKKAEKLAPNREHTHYALAAAHALQGNSGAALEHLKTAITLKPAIRFQAVRDNDFESLASDPQFRDLMRPEAS